MRRSPRSIPPGKRVNPARYVITYGVLCDRASVPHLTHSVGNYLVEIAEWCEEEGYPPLNSLAVSRDTGIPGTGYDGAGGFSIIDWPQEVEECIRFTKYPARGPTR